jgi:two-component system phosphate regulon sensor histidine kinase PhoR
MRFNSSFFFRLFLVYSLLCVGIIGIYAVMQNRSIQVEITDRVEKELTMQAGILIENIRSSLITLDQTQIANQVRQLSLASNNRFTVISPQGIVIADSHQDASQMANHLRRPEIQNAIQSGSGQMSRYSQTIEENLLYYAQPVFMEGMLLGIVRSAYFTDQINDETSSKIGQNMFDALIAAFLGVVLIAMAAFLQAGSVEKLALIASDISAGNFRGRVPVKNALGLKKLAEVINQLARNSAVNISDITADRNRLAAIFAGMVEGVIDVDQEQRILHINEAASKLLGVNSLESTGKPIWEEVRNNEITQALDEAMRTRSFVKSQIDLNSAKSLNNGRAVIDIYAASLSDDLGKPIGAVVVLHDISELKSLERIRTDFVANASHELKTPITAIRGLSESVIDDENIDRETILQFFNRIHSQSIRLSQLVGDLMALSRLEVDLEEKQFSLINMKSLLKNSVKSAKVAIEQKNQELLVNIAEDNIYVSGDRQNLSQLIDNLIDNAIKYTPENGVITINLRAVGTEMLLSVSDTGIGISPQYQQRIFERFYRVDKARSRSLGGTGLGLSIVKNIAEKHLGDIQLLSQQGRGSTFSYRMPLASSIKSDS